MKWKIKSKGRKSDNKLAFKFNDRSIVVANKIL